MYKRQGQDRGLDGRAYADSGSREPEGRSKIYHRCFPCLLYTSSVVAKAIAKLIAAGYITREQNAKDKRAFNLFPTKKAWDVYPTLIQQGDLCMELLTDGLTMEERAELSLLLEKMVQNTLTKFPLSKSK